MNKKLAKNTKTTDLDKEQQASIKEGDKNLSTVQNEAILIRGLIREKSKYDPELLIEEIGKTIRKYRHLHKNKKSEEEFRKKIKENAIPLMYSNELENFDLLVESFPEKYRSLAVRFVKEIIQEYSCKTSSEIALAEIVASAYIRQLRATSRLYTGIEGDVFLSTEKNSFSTILSKELDRATRTYITAITTLKHIKNPPIELNVKATTAFIAENQQVNVSNNQNLNKGEINERQ